MVRPQSCSAAEAVKDLPTGTRPLQSMFGLHTWLSKITVAAWCGCALQAGAARPRIKGDPSRWGTTYDQWSGGQT
eukprot:1141387-Pelagomonas_calceolata.AAC.5